MFGLGSTIFGQSCGARVLSDSLPSEQTIGQERKDGAERVGIIVTAKPAKKKEVPVQKEKMVKPGSTGEPNFSVKPASAGDASLSVKPSNTVDSGQTKDVKASVSSIHTDEAEEEPVESDEDSVMAYPIQIDGIEYNIDDTNNVYTDDGELVGVYNRLKKSWLSKI